MAKWFIMKKRRSVLNRISFEELFVKTTKLVAKRSSCVKAQQAALLIKDNRIISFGYNGPPAGTLNCLEDGGEEACGKDSNGSCRLGIHAEQNAIADCAKRGVCCLGAEVYITHYPCIICCRILLASGITSIKYIEDYKNDELVKKFTDELNVEVIQI